MPPPLIKRLLKGLWGCPVSGQTIPNGAVCSLSQCQCCLIWEERICRWDRMCAARCQAGGAGSPCATARQAGSSPTCSKHRGSCPTSRSRGCHSRAETGKRGCWRCWTPRGTAWWWPSPRGCLCLAEHPARCRFHEPWGFSQRQALSPWPELSLSLCSQPLCSPPAAITPMALQAMHLLQGQALPCRCGGLGLILVLWSVTELLLPREPDPALAHPSCPRGARPCQPQLMWGGMRWAAPFTRCLPGSCGFALCPGGMGDASGSDATSTQ